MKPSHFTRLLVFITLISISISAVLFSQSFIYTTSREKTKNHNEFAGGSSCCNCNTEHYGQLPPDFPIGKVRSITFYLTTSRENSYYTKIESGPTKLKLILGDRESIAISKKTSPEKKLPLVVPWFIEFDFLPPAAVKPDMHWKLLDGDNNIYSAVLLHSGDVDLTNGLRGYYKTYDCQYTRIEDQSYSVKFDFASTRKSIKSD